jgi:hypothetical protein
VTTATLTPNATVALDLASRGWRVMPTCWPVDGRCGCPGAHEGHNIGKAPLGRLVPRGVDDATADPETIARWWRQFPLANVSVALSPAGLLMVDPDSDLARADAHKRGMGQTIIRRSRNDAYIFQAPDGCPAARVIHDGPSAALDVLTDGYALVHGTHASGAAIGLDETHPLGTAPAWAVELVTRKSTEKADRAHRAAERAAGATEGDTEPPVRLHPRGMQRWRGELVQTTDGRPDTSDSLFYIGLDLAECNASHSAIVAALAERDVALGWRKFSDRSDADERYGEIADKAVAREDARRQGGPSDMLSWPTLKVDPAEAGPANGECSPHCDRHLEVIEAQKATIAGERTERERLGRLVNARAAIDRNPDLTPADKLVIPHALGLVYHRKDRDADHAPRQVVYLQAVRARTGLSEKTVSKCLEKVPELGKQLEHNKAKDGRIITILADLPSEAHAIMGAANHHPALPRNQGGRTDRPRYRGCPNGCDVPLSVQPVTTVTCTGCGSVTDELPGKRSQVASSESKSQVGIYSDAPNPTPPVSTSSMTRKDGIYSGPSAPETAKSQLGIYPDGPTRAAIDDLVRRHRSAPQPPSPEADVGYDPPPNGARSPWLLSFLTLGSAARWQSHTLCGVRVRSGQRHWEQFAAEHPDSLPRVVEQLRQLRQASAGVPL